MIKLKKLEVCNTLELSYYDFNYVLQVDYYLMNV